MTELLLTLIPLKMLYEPQNLNWWKYQHDPSKPPFFYTTIILSSYFVPFYLAIRPSKIDKVALGDICKLVIVTIIIIVTLYFVPTQRTE